MVSNISKKKRALNAYNLFCQDEKVRNTIKQENPDWGSAEIMKELGTRWNNLSEQEKSLYNEQAKKNKEIFLENSQNDEDMVKVLKRPKSSYMHFSNNREVRDKIKQQHPDWKVTQIASHLGSVWNKMSEGEKQVWESKALQEKNELSLNPVYIYKKRKVVNKQSSMEARIKELEKIVLQLQHTVQQLTSHQE